MEDLAPKIQRSIETTISRSSTLAAFFPAATAHQSTAPPAAPRRLTVELRVAATLRRAEVESVAAPEAELFRTSSSQVIPKGPTASQKKSMVTPQRALPVALEDQKALKMLEPTIGPWFDQWAASALHTAGGLLQCRENGQ
eukprot:s1363_g9.t1